MLLTNRGVSNGVHVLVNVKARSIAAAVTSSPRFNVRIHVKTSRSALKQCTSGQQSRTELRREQHDNNNAPRS